jgi:hypothetical protein
VLINLGGGAMKQAAYLLLVLMSGCTPLGSPGMTLLQSLNHYREGVGELENQPDRWPERQRMGDALKTRYMYTIGPSAEFNHLVDLDFRRREFLITLHDPSLKPERSIEIKEELLNIDNDIATLVERVKAQVANVELATRQQPRAIEVVAATGLASLGIERFLSPGVFPHTIPPSITVGNRYVVTDYGSYSTIKTPDGQMHRCATIILDEGIAAIECH